MSAFGVLIVRAYTFERFLILLVFLIWPSNSKRRSDLRMWLLWILRFSEIILTERQVVLVLTSNQVAMSQ